MTVRRRHVGYVVVVAMMACRSPVSPPVADVRVYATEVTIVRAATAAGLRVGFVIENRGDGPVDLQCGKSLLRQASDSSWVTVAQAACAASAIFPADTSGRVRPGAQRAFQAYMLVYTPMYAVPTHWPANGFAGTYRLATGIRSGGKWLPVEMSTTPPFAVTEPVP